MSSSMVFVSQYNNVDVLAHTPRVKPGAEGLQLYRLNNNGRLKHVSSLVIPENPAFIVRSKTHPNVYYVTTECINKQGDVYTLKLEEAADSDSDILSKSSAPKFRVLHKASTYGKSSCCLWLPPNSDTNILESTDSIDSNSDDTDTSDSSSGCSSDVDSNVDTTASVAKSIQRNSSNSSDYDFAVVTNYWDATISLLKVCPRTGIIDSNLKILSRPGANECVNKTREEHWMYRQKWPHPHCCVEEPYLKRYIFVCDLGLDQIMVFDSNTNIQQHPNTNGFNDDDDTNITNNFKGLNLLCNVQLEKTRGPRHIVFNKDKPIAYVVNELNNTVTTLKVQLDALVKATSSTTNDTTDDVYTVDSSSAHSVLVDIDNKSTLPLEFEGKGVIHPNGVWKASSHCSEIHVDPKNEFVAVGNRGHDSLTMFKIDHITGMLTLIDYFDTNGECPRNFSFDPSGNFIIVGNQNSDKLVVFKLNRDTGALTKTDEMVCYGPNYVYAV